MAPRSTWKGFLKVSLVSIPIKVYPASESAATLSFHQLHDECRTRIQQKRWCPHCEREVANTELAKGYEFEKGRYVVLEEDDFAKVATESTRVINLVQFADAEELDPIYFDRPYFLAPDGPMASEAYAVMREGMKGKTGIGKLALYGREYLVAVQPRDKGIVMFTLHHAAEIRSMDQIDELRTVPAEIKADEAKLARQVIGSFDGHLDMANFHDEYRDGLRAIIDAKIAGEEVVAQEPVEAPQKVVNLMDALRKSLDAAGAGRKKTAKAELGTGAQAPARRKASAHAPVARAAERKRKAG
jgi:DNA end-binding protein Ku